MIKIRPATLDDIEEIVDMYYELIAYVYPRRNQTSIAYYYNNVLNWFKQGADVTVSYNDEELTGFTLGYLDDFDGVIEPYYKADIAYVKQEYRNGRSAYLLYNNVMQTKSDYVIETHSMTGESASIADKYCDTIYIVHERDKQ